MSRAKLGNSELRFYTDSGGSETTKIKMVPTNNVLTIQGATAGTKVTLSNLADPSSSADGATKSYVDTQLASKVSGLSWKKPVRAKTTANLTGTLSSNEFTMGSNGALVVDGQSLVLDDRLLVANQVTVSENGVYVVTTVGDGSNPAVLARASDCLTGESLNSAAVFVERGVTNKDAGYVQTEDNITINVSRVEWEQFAGFAELTAGAGLSKTGNQLSANVDDTSIEISGGSISVKSGGVSNDALGSKVVSNAEIQDATILVGQMADDACETRVIKDANVTNAKLAATAVNTNVMVDSCVTSDKINTGAVTSTKIVGNAIQTSHLSTGCVDSDAIGSSQVLSASIAGNAVLTSHIGAGQVQNTNILDSAVTSGKIASNAVVSSKVAANNILETHHVSGGVSERALANSSVSNTKLKSASVSTSNLQAGCVTESELGNSSVTTSKIGTLTSLTVNGLVTATGFLAGGSSSDSDGGFSLPKCKSLSIDFDTDQTIAGDGTFYTIGGSVAGAGINFSYDDNITMALVLSSFRFKHQGTSGDVMEYVYEFAYYDASQNQLGFSDRFDNDDMGLLNASEMTYTNDHMDIIGNGTSRIASIRLRIKHSQSADTLKITDSLQITAFAVDDNSGNTQKTYTSGTLS